MFKQYYSKFKWLLFFKWKGNKQATASTVSEVRLGKILLSNPDTYLLQNTGVLLVLPLCLLACISEDKKKTDLSYPLQKCTLSSPRLCSGWEKLKPLHCICADCKLEAVMLYSMSEVKTNFIKAQSLTNVKRWHNVEQNTNLL